VYSTGVVYNLAINPAMTYTGFYLGGNRVVAAPQLAWMGLAIGSSVAILGMVMMGCAMNATHRHTFYKPCSLRALVDTLWEERNLTNMPDETMAAGLDPSRAEIIGFTPDYWVSTDKLRVWLLNWDAWEASKPEWFTAFGLTFQRRIVMHAPADALPRTVLLKILTKAAEQRGEQLQVDPEADTDYLVAEVQQVRRDATARQRAHRFAKAALAVRLYIIAITISYVDLVGDMAVGFSLLQSKSNVEAGYTTLGLTAASLVVQAIISMSMGQGTSAAFAALVGAKPLLDTYNVLAVRPLTQGTPQQHKFARYLTLAEEVVLQALPQGFFQCLVVMRMARAGEAPSWVQWASLGGALVAIGFIGADLESAIDEDPIDRKRMPHLYGYLPSSEHHRRSVVLAGVSLYLAGFLATKWVVFSALASVGSVVVLLWLCGEFVGWLTLRYAIEGKWLHAHTCEGTQTKTISRPRLIAVLTPTIRRIVAHESTGPGCYSAQYAGRGDVVSQFNCVSVSVGQVRSC
jgi:hypothetical protein